MNRRIAPAVSRAAAAVVVIGVLPIMALVLVRGFYGVPLSAYRPIINDEVAYWHQAFSFSQVGFNGGYYTVEEATNPSGVTPFGPHGPGFALLYGSVGSLIGWHRHSVVLLNLFAFAGAALVWVMLSGATTARLLLAALLLATYWHTMFWALTGMQEGLHHAGAIALAGCFAYALRPSPRKWVIAGGWIALAVLSFIRPSWIIVMPAWAFATMRHARAPMKTAIIAGAALLSIAILIAYSRTVAPYSNGFFFLRVARFSVGARALLDNMSANLQRVSYLNQYSAIELIHRAQYVTVLIATLVGGIVVAWRALPARRIEASAHLIIAAGTLAVALAMMFLLYEFASYVDHRILSAFLLFGSLLCAASGARAGLIPVAVLVVSNIAVAGTALRETEAARRDQFIWDDQSVRALHDVMTGRVAYHPASSRWCNTLLTSKYPPDLIAVPAGIGISVVQFADHLPTPPRSRYLLLDAEALSALRSPHHLTPIATLPFGTLYLNRDAKCDPAPPGH